MVNFKGFNQFNGRIIHAHEFRNANSFKNQNVLIIGNGFSGEDIGLQCYKFGAKSITMSYRTKSLGFNWPDSIREVPLLKEVYDGNKCKFINDEIIESIDSIILCTGYKHSFPFLSDDSLRLKTENILYPDNLYKGIVWVDNPNLFYLGMQDQWYTFTMFDLQSHLTKDIILNNIKLPDQSEMIKDIKLWKDIEKNKTNNDSEMILYQTNYIKDLYKQLKYPLDYTDDINKLDYSQIFEEWEHDKHDNILTYRDACYTSKLTGIKAVKFHTPWEKSLDDSIKCFITNGGDGGDGGDDAKQEQ